MNRSSRSSRPSRNTRNDDDGDDDLGSALFDLAATMFVRGAEQVVHHGAEQVARRLFDDSKPAPRAQQVSGGGDEGVSVTRSIVVHKPMSSTARSGHDEGVGTTGKSSSSLSSSSSRSSSANVIKRVDITPSTFDKESELGRGGFGVVHRGVLKGHTDVAVKIIKKKERSWMDRASTFLSISAASTSGKLDARLNLLFASWQSCISSAESFVTRS
jgi:hypothetical protein